MGKIVAACVVLAIVFAAMLASRSQALQRFAVLELVLALAVSGSAYLGYEQGERFARKQYLDMYGLYVGRLSRYLEQLEERGAQAAAGELDTLLVQTLPVATVDEEESSYMGAVLLSRTDDGGYRQVLSFGTHRSVYADNREQALALVKKSLDNRKVSHTVTEDNTGLLALVDAERIAPGLALLVEVSLAPLDQGMRELYTDTLRGGILLFLFGSLLLAVIIRLQGRELRGMIRMVTRVAQGKAPWEEMRAGKGFFGESNEMRALRNSLSQLVSDGQRESYMKYRMLQACYRFVPKHIEKLLDKPSILDVEQKDHTRMNGILAFVSVSLSESLEGQEMVARLDENYKVIMDAKREGAGVFLNGSPDLSTLCFLFPDRAGEALQFGVDAVTRREDVRRKGQTFVLLHDTELIYGVTGDERQASPYVLSREMRVLEGYTELLRGMGVRMAVTDSVYELLGENVPVRYIGFIEKGRFCFKLYEILDAYPAKERQSRLDTKQAFQEAMNLFYQDDFYLARNLFTDVLKENPTDEVAKRYVFLCETCLNSGVEGVSYGLFGGEK